MSSANGHDTDGHITNGNGKATNEHSNSTREAHASEDLDVTKRFSLSERSIIVTGAAGGLGFTVTEALLQSGADVIAIDRGESPTHASWSNLQGLAKKLGRDLTYCKCDVASPENISSVFNDAVSKARHPLRGLVNCAGIGWLGPSIDFPVEEARQIIDVNLVGTLLCAQAAARIVQRQGLSASFVFIASMSGYVVNKGTPNAAYAASKAGVQQLARNLAAEWGNPTSDDGKSSSVIRVNTISPGVIRTPMTSGILQRPHLDEMWTENTMLKRLSTPEDYTGSAIFLLSDASNFITAADLIVDGGYTAW